MPSPPPKLRDGVTEVHYSRWVVEESNKEVGDELRSHSKGQKSFRKQQVEKFLLDQHRKVSEVARDRDARNPPPVPTSTMRAPAGNCCSGGALSNASDGR